MKRRLAPVFAAFTLIFVVGLSIPSILLETLNSTPATLPHNILTALIILSFAMVGILIVIRRPENSIGWLVCVASLTWALSGFSLDYAAYGLITRPGALPAVDLMGMIGYCTQSVGFFLIFTFLLLLFPTGHLPSPRWRPLFVAAAILLSALALVSLFGATTDNNTQLSAVVKNPIGLIDSNVSNLLSTTITFGLSIVSILCGISLIVRARRASGVERQQIKWLGYAAILCILFVVFLIVVMFALNGDVDTLAFYIPLLAIAAATGVSILRYRLFDIDVIIRRTLVYASLTVVLAGIYFIGVVGMEQIISALTGQQTQQNQPAILIVVTTLLVAALFQPLRQRIQRFIDHRFYRSRYDIRKTLDQFGASLRNEVELTHLTSRLLETIEQTMHPAHISLWLHEAPKRQADN